MLRNSWVASFCFLLFFLFLLCSNSFASNKVTVITISGEIDNASSLYVDRVITKANAGKSSILVMNIDSKGGDEVSVSKIKNSISKIKVPFATFVTGDALNQAYDILNEASKVGKVYVTPDAKIGLQDGKLSPLSKEQMQILINQNSASEIPMHGVIDANRALELKLCDGICTQISDFVKDYNNHSIELLYKKPTSMEMLAGSVANPAIAVICLVLGILAALKEITLPSHGVAAVLALLFFAIFFTGKFIAGSATLLILILLLVGIIMLILEIFFIPGTGAAGFIGFGCVAASIVLSYEDPITGAWVLFAVIILTLLLGFAIFKYAIEKKDILAKFAPKPLKDGTEDFTFEPIDYSDLLNKTGVAETQLKPGGKIAINEQVADAITGGEYIPQGESVKVVAVEGNKIVVKKIDSK